MDIKLQGMKLVGPFFDGSGYGAGARNWVKSLVKKGFPIFLQPVSFEKDRPNFQTVPFDRNDPTMGSMHDMMDGLCRHQIPYDVNFVRLSPEVAVRFLEPNSINICSTAWECSKLHPHWVECCNKFDAIFVESEWAAGVFRDSGVSVPVLVTPNGIDATEYKLKEHPNLTETFKFYSIQQWTERKNGMGLLKAYFRAFTKEDDVLLILKTYETRVMDNYDNTSKIKADIEQLKKSLQFMREFPPVYLVTDNLTDEDIRRMHEECDCYAMLDRGESWGIPYVEAAAAGNPIISTNWGGTRQFLHEGNSYPVDYMLEPVFNMQAVAPFYNGDIQNWSCPSILHAAALMRHVYDNRQEAFNVGLEARKDIETNFNFDQIGDKLISAIAEVVALKRGMK